MAGILLDGWNSVCRCLRRCLGNVWIEMLGGSSDTSDIRIISFPFSLEVVDSLEGLATFFLGCSFSCKGSSTEAEPRTGPMTTPWVVVTITGFSVDWRLLTGTGIWCHVESFRLIEDIEKGDCVRCHNFCITRFYSNWRIQAAFWYVAAIIVRYSYLLSHVVWVWLVFCSSPPVPSWK